MRYVLLFIGVFLTETAFSMADTRMPVYGTPKIYGEYEISSEDVIRVSKMYGNEPRFDSESKEVKKNHKKVNKKKKIKAVKKVKKKKVEKNELEKQQSLSQQVIEPVVVSEDKVGVVEKNLAKTLEADENAKIIANQAMYKYDVDSYCIRRNSLYRGIYQMV